MPSFARASVLIALMVLPQPAHAQVASTRRMFVGVNPLGIPWDIFHAELESGISDGATVGAVVSYIDVDHKRNTSFDVKARYYPSEQLFNRLSTGVSLGVTKFSRFIYEPTLRQNEWRTLSAPTVGVVLDYNWTHGSNRRFVVGLGVGAKRILASRSDRESLQLDRAYPTGRFVIGIAY